MGRADGNRLTCSGQVSRGAVSADAGASRSEPPQRLRRRPRYTADQLGHTDPKFTFPVYAQASKRRERLAPVQRRAFDEAIVWAQMGTNADFAMPQLPVRSVAVGVEQ